MTLACDRQVHGPRRRSPPSGRSLKHMCPFHIVFPKRLIPTPGTRLRLPQPSWSERTCQSLFHMSEIFEAIKHQDTNILRARAQPLTCRRHLNSLPWEGMQHKKWRKSDPLPRVNPKNTSQAEHAFLMFGDCKPESCKGASFGVRGGCHSDAICN